VWKAVLAAGLAIGDLAIGSSAMAQVVGQWTGTAMANGAPVRFVDVYTADYTATRRAYYSTGMVIHFVGHYEINGAQLHVMWDDWSNRPKFTNGLGPLGDDCMMRFNGPDKFECGGVVYDRVR
jgi:hypothetical protein